MSKRFLTEIELSHGPDLLRPGSSTAHLGNGQIAFIYTRHHDQDGNRFFTAPASTGHECMITQENILQALFGQELDKIIDGIIYSEEEFVKEGITYVATGRKKTHYDHREIRRRSKDTNLYGRYGSVRGRPVLMIWQRNEGWEAMLDKVIELLQVPGEAILTVGNEEIGSVAEYWTERRA